MDLDRLQIDILKHQHQVDIRRALLSLSAERDQLQSKVRDLESSYSEIKTEMAKTEQTPAD